MNTGKFMREQGFHFQGQHMTAILTMASKGGGWNVVAVDHEGTRIEPSAPGILPAIEKAIHDEIVQDYLRNRP